VEPAALLLHAALERTELGGRDRALRGGGQKSTFGSCKGALPAAEERRGDVGGRLHRGTDRLRLPLVMSRGSHVGAPRPNGGSRGSASPHAGALAAGEGSVT